MRLSTIRNLTTEVITHRIIINVPFWMPWRNLIWEMERKKMDDIRITILYRNGEEEEVYVADYDIVNGCLMLQKRYKETRYIPLDLIKEWGAV